MRQTLEEKVIGAYFKFLKDIEDGVVVLDNGPKEESGSVAE